MEAFNTEQINEVVKRLDNWSCVDDALEKRYQFKDFRDTIGFMSRVAFEIEEMNHHPEWLNVYNKLKVRLKTHDVNGITKKDYQLAKKLDEHFAKYGK
jgi:4a-hydroxytetrahydrobiopterin dehydratase